MKIENKIKAVKEEKSYGHLTLNSSEFPFVKDLSIGDIKQCVITTRVKELREASKWEISDKMAKPGDIFVSVTITDISMHKPVKGDKKGGEY